MGRICATRRHLLIAAGAAGPALALGAPAWAQGIKPNVARAGSWVLGDKLSLAAIGYGRGVAQETVDRFLKDAQSIAGTLGVTVKPFPPKEDTSSKTLAAVIHYLIKGDGWGTGGQLVNKYGREHGILFEVSVKSNLLLLLYQPGDDSGIGGIIQSRLQEIKLPERLWGEVVNLIRNKAPGEAVREAVFKMHKEVGVYLLDS